jgi:hypothetical protein
MYLREVKTFFLSFDSDDLVGQGYICIIFQKNEKEMKKGHVKYF